MRQRYRIGMSSGRSDEVKIIDGVAYIRLGDVTDAHARALANAAAAGIELAFAYEGFKTALDELAAATRARRE